MFVMTIIGLTLCIFCGVTVEAKSRKGEFNPTHIYIVVLFIFTQTIRTIVIIKQCLFHEQTYFQLLITYNRIEQLFAKHLNHKINFKYFTDGVAQKVTIGVLAFVQFAAIRAWMIWYYEEFNVLQVIFKVLQFLTLFTCVHLVFSVDALQFFMEQLLEVITRDAAADRLSDPWMVYKHSAKCSHLRNQLKNYKNVHFVLWENSRRLNSFFGWSMIVVLLMTFVDIAYMTYGVLNEIQNFHTINLKTIREFLLSIKI